MALTGDPYGKSIINEAAQLMGNYCASPNCLNKKSNGRQFCIECIGKETMPPSKVYDTASKIYFIKQGDFVKIGFTRNVEKRMTHLQIGNPEDIELLADEYGDQRTERWLHQLFKKQHHRGEWFKLDDELTKYIDCLKEGLGIYKTCEIAFTD